jgi:hypothetical protein
MINTSLPARSGLIGLSPLGRALGMIPIVAAVMALGHHAAYAQSAIAPTDEPAEPGLEILITPYLWLPWVGVSAHPADSRIASKSTVISPVELFGHLTWVPFMGEAEFRYGPFALITDYIHAPLTAGVSTHDILFSGANAGLTLDTGSAMLMYRSIIQPDQYVDVGIGARAWGLAGNISLDEGILPSVSVANGLSWGDPLIGARYHRDFDNRFGATAYADVGGFGAGAHIDWQVVGTIDYSYDSRIDLHAGLRSLNFNYGAPRANIQLNMLGPILTLTYRLDG